MKKQQKIPNSSQRKTVGESNKKEQLVNQNKIGEKSIKLIKDERNNRRQSEAPAALKNKLKEDEREGRKNYKQEKEKKEHKRNIEEEIRKTKDIRDNPKAKEKLNKKKEEENEYEDDFEDYESDFEEDLDENEEAKNARLEEDKEEESILRKKLTGNNRINIIESERINRIKVDKEDINKEREFLHQKEIVETQEDRGFIEPKIETEKNNQEWFADYFKEVTGQNLHRRQVFTQTEGPELNAYSQTEFIENETVETQTGKYIKACNSQKSENRQNAGLARFVGEAGQLMIGLLQQSTSSNFEKISSVFSSRTLSLSLNSILTENSTGISKNLNVL
uniref:Uncharacterized protein n=1 Tax=Meloidogyne hapla TaxID=6305 RepID=A0A1I8AYJ3_MELHA